MRISTRQFACKTQIQRNNSHEKIEKTIRDSDMYQPQIAIHGKTPNRNNSKDNAKKFKIQTCINHRTAGRQSK